MSDYPKINTLNINTVRDSVREYIITIMETYVHQEWDVYTRRAVIRDTRQYLNYVQAQYPTICDSAFWHHTPTEMDVELEFLSGFAIDFKCLVGDAYSMAAFDRAMKGI